MPPKDYRFELSDKAFGTVYFKSSKGVILEFVVKLYFVSGNKEFEVIRYDVAHGGVHKDILLPDGSKQDLIPYHYLDNKQGLTFAVKDIYLHWEFYIERFEQWLRKEKK